MTETLMRARGLSRTYPTPRTRGVGRAERTVGLADVDLSVLAGSAVGIIGESGSGKSTLVRLLLGLDVPSAGTVEVDGRPVDARGSARSVHWLRRATGIVFQDPYASLDPRMSVERIVGEPLWALGVEGDRRARVREVLEQVGLDADMAARFPHEFSGGQRQRIALARAIVHRPRILVGDEPLSALDVTVRAQILRLLARLRVEEDLTLVLVSHDIGVVQNVCDQVVVMKDGRVVEQGPTEKVLLQPQAAYTRQLLASIPTLPA
ncbi:ABC-type glutathione transport system ATPase component [Microbacterium testaceum]|uniref:ABC transporter ATP-binding protein n=1 Tax=Microbacterium TaxID=33882 RepID=UPI002787B390|nr:MULTISPECIES: ATP-binding cassette domain-containing protein [Microbacterium]MDQ1113102.1 ABC-type glutathione transport system ATPase component [Microbacterium testaceum]MDR6099801.1 ABC-type glutathione transport system ATPase component [Microbacterium sp. SORGH_AS_0454]